MVSTSPHYYTVVIAFDHNVPAVDRTVALNVVVDLLAAECQLVVAIGLLAAADPLFVADQPDDFDLLAAVVILLVAAVNPPVVDHLVVVVRQKLLVEIVEPLEHCSVAIVVPVVESIVIDCTVAVVSQISLVVD